MERRQPAVTVLDPALHDVEKGLLQGCRHRAALAVPDGNPVHGTDRRDLGGRAGEEHLVGRINHLARNGLFLHLEIELPGELDHGEACDAGQRRGGERRRAEATLPDEEKVLARALGDAPVVIERDPLVIAVRDRFHLDELAVRVIRGGLGHGGHRVRSDAHPGRAARVDSLLEGVRAKILPPLVAADRHVHRVRERVHSERAVAAVDEGPDVARLEVVRAHDLESRLPQLVDRVRNHHPVDLRGPEEAVEVIVEAEDRGPARRVVTALPFEDAGPVVQSVGEDVYLRVREVDQLPVHPDLLDVFEAHRVLRLRRNANRNEPPDPAAISAGIDQSRERHDHGGFEAEDAGTEREKKRMIFFELREFGRSESSLGADGDRRGFWRERAPRRTGGVR